MNITLKKLKTAGGDETPRFSAQLCVDGKVVADVSNGGTGGCNRNYWTQGYDPKPLLTWALAESRRREPTLFKHDYAEEALGYLVNTMVENAAIEARMTRACKKSTLVRFHGDAVGSYRSINRPYDPAHALDPRIAVVLNALAPSDRVLRLNSVEA